MSQAAQAVARGVRELREKFLAEHDKKLAEAAKRRKQQQKGDRRMADGADGEAFDGSSEQDQEGASLADAYEPAETATATGTTTDTATATEGEGDMAKKAKTAKAPRAARAAKPAAAPKAARAAKEPKAAKAAKAPKEPKVREEKPKDPVSIKLEGTGKTVFINTTRPLMLKALEAGLKANVFLPEEKVRAEKFVQRIKEHA